MLIYNMTRNDIIKTPLVKENIISFLDSTGRALFGERIPSLDTKDTTAIKNSVVVHVVPQQSGTMALQLLPAFFREFLGESDATYVHHFPNASIAIMEQTVFDFKLYGQYEAMFKPAPQVVTASAQEGASAEGQVVKMFDK